MKCLQDIVASLVIVASLSRLCAPHMYINQLPLYLTYYWFLEKETDYDFFFFFEEIIAELFFKHALICTNTFALCALFHSMVPIAPIMFMSLAQKRQYVASSQKCVGAPKHFLWVVNANA